MSEPRAQRAVAPHGLSAVEPGRRGARRGEGSRRTTHSSSSLYATLAPRGRDAARRASREPERTPTPDEIHQLRVAARRLRVALRLFRPHAAEQGRRALPRRPALVRELARRRARSRRVRESFKAYVPSLPPEQRGELSGYELYLRRERAEARQRAAAAFASPRTDVAVRRPRSASSPRAERRRVAPLGLVDGARRRAHQHPREARRAFGGSATSSRLALAAHASFTSCASRRNACATSSSSSPTRIRALKQPAKELQNASGSARHTSRRLHGHGSAAPLRQPAQRSKAARERPAAARSSSCAAASSRSRASVRRSFAADSGRLSSRSINAARQARCLTRSAALRMRLFAIGDIQGCAAAFDALLRKIAFRPSRDRLWLVGDLVNRGPDSLGVLRRVMGLGRSVTCVLGNHDLHLLATVAGRRELSPADTFRDVLEAPDLGAIVDWLRHRPLLHYDAHAKRVLVHAGIPPAWTVAQARAEARDVETQLRGRKWRHALKDDVRRRAVGLEPEAARRRPPPLHDQRADAHAVLRPARPHRPLVLGRAGHAAERADSVVRRARTAAPPTRTSSSATGPRSGCCGAATSRRSTRAASGAII